MDLAVAAVEMLATVGAADGGKATAGSAAGCCSFAG